MFLKKNVTTSSVTHLAELYIFQIIFMVYKVKLTQCFFIVAFGLMLFACNPAKRLDRDYNYFQKGLDTTIKSLKYKEPTIAAGDNIAIQVVAGSLSQQDATLFNLATGSNLSSANLTGPINNTISSGANYLVDKDGNITMPKIGKLKADGFTKQELSNIITKKLIESEFVKDPLVIVRLAQFRVNVLGEVKKPGTVIFKSEKTNILEVLAEAGDLTDFGKRDDVVVMRQEKDKWITYKLNLKNTDFFTSDGFFLKNNDVVYVGANDKKLKQLQYPNLQRDVSLISVAIQSLFFVIQAVFLIRSLN